ncbi:MAG TPA: transcriptional repressor LexA [Candidatus Avacidaminococcus intestinavium]|uniref:LexA repressor n=1 Tax=Candidatus Avacidaminococcus intestinavium TaxID=2840684 RepID=A0A9D1MNV6_9FIRM|nr:transcriptional repressor LexA [Candidatus Avacidaminococcus intestinavium]
MVKKRSAKFDPATVSNEETILSERQQQILNFVREYVYSKGYPPAVREIGNAVGLSSSASVHSHLQKLEKLGFLQRDPSKPRALELTQESSWRQKTVVPVPLVGSVTAGQPILALENIEETYPLPLDLIGCEDEVFMLAVSGDSMKNAGILDRDYIVVRRQNFANNGDIVVALIDDEETTVKRYYRELTHIRLQPENDAYQPIVGTNIKVMGKVVALFRML